MENETAYPIREDYDFDAHSESSLSAPVKQYINGMYEEFKKCFELRNFSKIDKIIKNIANVDPASNILNLIYGTLSLFKGQGVDSYNYLFKYAQNSQEVDLWATSMMAIWNLMARENTLALQQFGKIVEGQFSTRFLIFILISAAKTKKRLGFLDKALEYFQRLLAVPEGFNMLPMIKLEIIHIYILKKQYELALEEIEVYSSFGTNSFIKRLRVYILYLNRNFKEILKHKRDNDIDPYIAYIIARIGLENPSMYNVDVPYFLDEAIKNAKENEYIYNTYGNFYYSTHRFSDAAEQYNSALSLDPKFAPAINNLALFVKASSKSNQAIYVTKSNSSDDFVLSDVNPDVEAVGFLDTWKMLGFSSFRVDTFFLRKSPSLKYYVIND
ncbi:hypothetical protein GINT2_002088 [Glugoides intestinalis]